VIQDCDTLDLIWLSAAGETAPAILQHRSRGADLTWIPAIDSA